MLTTETATTAPTTAKPAPAPVRREERPAAAREVRRSTGGWRRTDILAVVGSFASAVALTWVVYVRLLPFDGPFGFVVTTYVAFLGLYALVVSFDETGPAVRDRFVSVVVHSLALVLMTALALVVTYSFWRGFTALRHLNFFTEDVRLTGPLDPLTSGGILHAIIGTLIMTSIALAITIPLGITCAVFLAETRGGFARFVRTIVEAMTALPSIVAGLFVYATLILSLGVDKSGFAAACAMSVMMLPIIIRASDVVLRLVPAGLKEAGYALGAGQWRTVWHVVLPTARSGLTTAVILGTARGVGETSPVLLTAGAAVAINTNPFSGPMMSLPLASFSFVRRPEDEMVARGFGTAAVLMFLVLVMFALARMIGGRGPGQLSQRQYRRRVRASRRTQQHFDELARDRAGIAPGFIDEVVR